MAAAAAACGGSPSKEQPEPPPASRKRGGDPRRRQAALFFLNNISLDGRPPCLGAPGKAQEQPPPPLPSPPPPPPPPPPTQPEDKAAATESGLLLPSAAEQDPGRGLGPALLPQLLLGSPLCPIPAPAPAAAAAAAGALAGMLMGAAAGKAPQGLLSPGTQSSSSAGAGGGIPLEIQRQRTKHLSGSPRHKGLKKMHFIKNMRQYDTRNSRIVLICAKRTLCVAFSILPYGESLRISELRIEGQKQRHPSGGVSVSSEMVLGMEGVELGADGKVVSYARFLYPTNALVGRKNEAHGAIPVCRAPLPRGPGSSRYKTPTAKTIPPTVDIGNDIGELIEYNPNLLDDPQWPCGKHKRVLIFASYMTTVIEYVKPSDLKKDMNETFKEKFPHIKLTLSKIRSLKREMRNLSMECNLEPVTVSMAYVYFEKLVLQGKLNKQNRKLCAGACVLLAAKISSDLRKHEVKHLIDKLEERFRFNRRDLIAFEFTVLVALELALYLPDNQMLPHFRRLTQQS
ncbi:CDK5 and ABL1 enzyme substrate 2 isoform X2 [Anolis carolinensis]|uniref:Cdk5 and Abl enzyme substrate 2 n=1 Tax=Anolis carolinensis TaxID=28377 RepID=G1KWB2_ANOCA|nr:PREDICTED: CDK5 and ABL1 enzyme substrate 2 isoform X1 [Anolis carolinensis]|eukprot:XP_016848952.1 PREDICTED: CDK5 and ABL1 enzyme substrate 2 isoform X1 [Anolis carolinensis]